MRVCGIIAEFNPLHKGHEYLLREARMRLNADHLLLVMSGDYTQRGEAAVIDRLVRTRLALCAGADAVLLLPLPFATGSAEYFARGAVSALAHSGVCTDLFFGSESGDLSPLYTLSEKIRDPLPFAERPSPNDLLGASYLNALADLKAPMKPHTLKRVGAAHDSSLPEGESVSASFLRKLLLSGKDLSSYLPSYAAGILSEYEKTARPVCEADFSDLLYYRLLLEKEQGYSGYFDVYPDLSDRIAAKLPQYPVDGDFVPLLKSREISQSHLRRALLHIMLGVRNELVDAIREENDYCPYLSLLGFKESASPLLHAIRKNCDRPFISKAADTPQLLEGKALECFRLEMRSSALYAHVASKTSLSPNPWTQSPVRL